MARSLAIMFTRGEARALLHRLEVWDCIADALDNPAAGERAEEMERELRNCGYLHVDTDSALDLDVLTDCIESSTWPAIHDPDGHTDNTRQAHAGAVRCLHGAMLKVAQAFGKSPERFDFPQA